MPRSVPLGARRASPPARTPWFPGRAEEDRPRDHLRSGACAPIAGDDERPLRPARRAPGARALIRRFGGVRGVGLAADGELAEAGLSGRRIRLLRAAVDLGVRAVAAVERGPRLSDPSAVARYFTAKLARASESVPALRRQC